MRAMTLGAAILVLTLSGCATSKPVARSQNSPADSVEAESQVRALEPKITLFDSVKRIEQYLKTEAKQDYSDRYLHSVRHHLSDGHPRKGACWLYHFAFKKPRLGGDVSIYHFMDDEIIEFHHGP
jgi:hypothetical protein